MLKKAFLLFILLVPYLADAQSFYAIRRPRNISVYGGLGSANYKGDLVNPYEFGKVRYNIVAGSEYFYSRRFTVKSELTWFRIAGSDANANDDRVERNLSFFSNCQELNLTGQVYLLKEPIRYYQRARVNFYAFAGVAGMHFNPKAKYNGSKYKLQPLETEAVHYSRFQFAIPYGFGLKIYMHPLYNLVIEGGYRTTFTDYLDDISSRRYPVDPTILKSDLSRALSDRRRERDPNYPIKPNVGVRGNPKNNDGYFLMSVKWQYYLPYEIGRSAEQRKVYRQKRKGYKPKRNIH